MADSSTNMHGKSESDIDQMDDNETPKDEIPEDGRGQTNTLETEKDTEEEDYKRSIFALDHFLWIFFFLFAIYNYITDFLVAYDWSETKDLCPNFRQIDGHSCIDYNRFENAGGTLLILTAFGFLCAMITKIYELYLLIMIYKRCNTKQEQQEYEFKLFRFDMFTSWLPLIVEDIASLSIITNALSRSAGDVAGIDASLVEQSVIITVLSIVFNYVNFMRKLCIKRKKIKENINEKMGKKCCCLPYICFIFWCIMGIGLFIGIVVAFNNIGDIYRAGDGNDEGGNGAFVYIEFGRTGSCRVASYHIDLAEDNREFYELPTEIIPYAANKSCNASDYKFQPQCQMIYDPVDFGDDHQLNCTLLWQYQGRDDNGNCGYNIPTLDNCKWNIPFPSCGNYSIPCGFSKGNATLYLCFGYCSFEGDL